MPEPDWAMLDIPALDYQDAYYYAAPKNKVKPKSLDEVDPKLLETYEKLGIPLKEQVYCARPYKCEDSGAESSMTEGPVL